MCYIKCGEVIILKPFSNISKWSIYLDQQFEPLHGLFLLHFQVE